jgi:hypothetical protein
MTIVSNLFQRRRLLVVCAATLALHLAAIDWAGSHLGSSVPRTAPHPPSVMTAQLRLTLPKRVESAPLVDVKPLAQDAPRPRARRPPPPAPLPPPPESAPATDALTAIAASPVLASEDSAPASGKSASQAQAGAGQAQTGTPPAPAEAPTPAPAVPAEVAPQGTRRYKVHLPPSAKFDMAVARVDADGTKWTGSASMTWHTDGSRYDASVEAGVSLLVTRVNLLVLRSEGVIDDYGIAPVRVTEKRTRRAETATHFNRDQGTITFSASERSYPLLTGAQDKATVPFQLGGIGRADVNQLGGDIDLQVGDEKEATIFRFQLVGEEELNTKMGKVVTWHLTRPPKPGTYSSRLDIWLAPGMNWYPVQMRNTEASGALTTQTVSNITITESGK